MAHSGDTDLLFPEKLPMIPRLKTCCFLFNLRVGSFVCILIHLGLEIGINAYEYLIEFKEDKYWFFWDVTMETICLTADGIALYGVYKEMYVFLVPCLVSYALRTILMIIFETIPDFSTENLISDLLIYGVIVYLWLVIFSYFCALRKDVRFIPAIFS